MITISSNTMNSILSKMEDIQETVINKLNRHELDEVLGLRNPPVPIKQIIACTCIILSSKSIKNQLLFITNWNAIKSFIRPKKSLREFISMIRALINLEFISKLEHDQLKEVILLLDQPYFTYEHMITRSLAAAKLVLLVKGVIELYYKIQNNLEETKRYLLLHKHNKEVLKRINRINDKKILKSKKAMITKKKKKKLEDPLVAGSSTTSNTNGSRNTTYRMSQRMRELSQPQHRTTRVNQNPKSIVIKARWR